MSIEFTHDTGLIKNEVFYEAGYSYIIATEDGKVAGYMAYVVDEGINVISYLKVMENYDVEEIGYNLVSALKSELELADATGLAVRIIVNEEDIPVYQRIFIGAGFTVPVIGEKCFSMKVSDVAGTTIGGYTRAADPSNAFSEIRKSELAGILNRLSTFLSPERVEWISEEYLPELSFVSDDKDTIIVSSRDEQTGIYTLEAAYSDVHADKRILLAMLIKSCRYVMQDANARWINICISNRETETLIRKLWQGAPYDCKVMMNSYVLM